MRKLSSLLIFLVTICLPFNVYSQHDYEALKIELNELAEESEELRKKIDEVRVEISNAKSSVHKQYPLVDTKKCSSLRKRDGNYPATIDKPCESNVPYLLCLCEVKEENTRIEKTREEEEKKLREKLNDDFENLMNQQSDLRNKQIEISEILDNRPSLTLAPPSVEENNNQSVNEKDISGAKVKSSWTEKELIEANKKHTERYNNDPEYRRNFDYSLELDIKSKEKLRKEGYYNKVQSSEEQFGNAVSNIISDIQATNRYQKKFVREKMNNILEMSDREQVKAYKYWNKRLKEARRVRLPWRILGIAGIAAGTALIVTDSDDTETNSATFYSLLGGGLFISNSFIFGENMKPLKKIRNQTARILKAKGYEKSDLSINFGITRNLGAGLVLNF